MCLYLGVFLGAYLLLGDAAWSEGPKAFIPGTAGFGLLPPIGGAFISYNMNTIETSSNILIMLTHVKFAFFRR